MHQKEVRYELIKTIILLRLFQAQSQTQDQVKRFVTSAPTGNSLCASTTTNTTTITTNSIYLCLGT